MTNNIRRLVAGFSSLALMLGSVVVGTAAHATTLDENLTLTEDVNECYTVSSGHNVTLDLGQYNITCSGANAVTVENGATLTITGSGAVTTATSGKAAIYNKVGGTVTVNGGTFNSANWYTVKNLGAMTIVDGSFSQGVSNSSNASLIANGWYNGANAAGASDQGNPYTGTVATLTINGGTFTHYTTTSTIKSDDYSQTVINNGVFHSANGFLVQATGDVAINDGSFTGYSALLTYNADGSAQYEPGTAVIRGGSVSATYMADADSAYSSLRVEGGVFAGLTSFLMRGELTSGVVTGGTFNIAPVDYVAEGSWAYYNNDTEAFVVEDAPVVSGLESNYNVRAGAQLVLDYTLTPEIAGNWIDIYSTEESDLCGESEILTNCIDFNAETKTLSVDPATTVGVHHMEYFLVDSTTGNFTLTVLPRGELTAESKTIYVDTSGNLNEYTFAELGVAAEGEGFTAESRNNNAWVDWENETVRVWGSDVITWSYAGEEKGKTTFKAYSVYDSSEAYGVRVEGYHYWYNSASEGVTARIADETIAKFTTTTERSGDEEYTQTVIEGVKAGTTALEYVFDGRVVKTVPIKVYEVATNMQRAQAVGTSQTFTAELSKGYKVVGFSVSAADSWTEEGENPDKSVEGQMNEDGTFTITVKKMPVWTVYGYGDEDEEETRTEKSPYAYAFFVIEDENGDRYDEGFGIVLFEFDAKDETAEAVKDDESEEAAVTNESVMADYVAGTIAGLFAGDIPEEGGDPVIIILDDNTAVVVEDPYALYTAVANGEKIEAVLTEPAKMTEDEVGALAAASMYNELGLNKSGARFVDVSVVLMSGDTTLGKITDLGTPLTVSVDVSDDKEAAPLAAGYRRVYTVVRRHNGVTAAVDGVEYDHDAAVVRFDSDRFSTYLIAYEDVEIANGEGTDVASPETGAFTREMASATSSTIISIIAVVAMAVLVSAAKFAKTRK